jgi:hypothetical protein
LNGLAKTRQEFLADLAHRVRFVYTPKHSSWINPVEIVFGIVMRKVVPPSCARWSQVLHRRPLQV